MVYHLLKPEVPGELGDNTVLNASVHPPHVTAFHLSITDWLGDELVRCFPCFAVTAELANRLTAAGLNGFRSGEVEVTLSEDAIELMGADAALSPFRWLQITGQPGHDDFGQTEKTHLVVSTAALDALRTHTLDHCKIEPYEPPTTPAIDTDAS